MSSASVLISIAIMAGITYATRVIPLVLFRKKIENRFLQSFLLYMPYGVLAAMVFPSIFSSTANIFSAIGGALVAILLAFFKKGLLPTALCATAAVFIIERIVDYIAI
ncbi:MAG: AzlD domain-containing protein [Oscillospiraceae bacterium]